MYEELMNRPMFQTPQRRQAGGIMAGVAPIRGYADGDLVEVEEEGFFDSIASREGRRDISDSAIDYASGVGRDVVGFGESQLMDDDERFNVRDVTNMLFDPEDPLDYATIALIGTPPLYIAQKLARKGYNAAQVAKQINKVEQVKQAERVKLIKPGQTYTPQSARSVDAPDLPAPPA